MKLELDHVFMDIFLFLLRPVNLLHLILIPFIFILFLILGPFLFLLSVDIKY